MTLRGPLFTKAIPIHAMLLTKSWKVVQTKQNVWVTLANTTQQETLCLSATTPNNPLSTCFAGLPADQWLLMEKAIHKLHPHNKWIHNPVDNWYYWTWDLPHAPLEPQELEILGSLKTDFSVKFHYINKIEGIQKIHRSIDIQKIRDEQKVWWDVFPIILFTEMEAYGVITPHPFSPGPVIPCYSYH